MAAAAATVTAVSSDGKRERDIVDAGMPKKAKRGRPPPPPEEVETFLAAAESTLARRFAAKYNYDVVKDAPMDGRYEWVRVGP
ncbi:hypothetical protein GQ55_2G281000 [Panicum hallii var. hallii]|uniref:Cyclin-dependent kinase inhibitor domain-containing protein n=1 Tax=Panicum hallii var. hallii TaxID=1504633 RepID=A0A2T7ET58_9POAL|nr:hypothetical protein GQ55_2G281000 [Panicum hallii var. hallii]